MKKILLNSFLVTTLFSVSLSVSMNEANMLFVLENLPTICATKNGVTFLENILKKNPQEKRSFVIKAREYIIPICQQSPHGASFLRHLITMDTDSENKRTKSLFILTIVHNNTFETLLKTCDNSNNALRFMQEAITQHPKGANELQPFFLEKKNFLLLSKSKEGCQLLMQLIKTKPIIKKNFHDLFQKHFKELNQNGLMLLNQCFFEKQNEKVKKYIPLIEKYPKFICKNYPPLLSSLLKRNDTDDKIITTLTAITMNNFYTLTRLRYSSRGGIVFIQQLLTKNPYAIKWFNTFSCDIKETNNEQINTNKNAIKYFFKITVPQKALISSQWQAILKLYNKYQNDTEILFPF